LPPLEAAPPPLLVPPLLLPPEVLPPELPFAVPPLLAPPLTPLPAPPPLVPFPSSEPSRTAPPHATKPSTIAAEKMRMSSTSSCREELHGAFHHPPMT
jgi:hypothetical protein